MSEDIRRLAALIAMDRFAREHDIAGIRTERTVDGIRQLICTLPDGRQFGIGYELSAEDRL